jgi:hypothetical protein
MLKINNNIITVFMFKEKNVASIKISWSSLLILYVLKLLRHERYLKSADC